MTRGVVRTASVSFMTFGTSIAMQGPVLPEIRHDLHVGNFVSGTFVAAQGAGWGLGALAGGPLANRRGRRLGYIAGTTLLATGLAVEAMAPVAAVALTGVFLTMLGAGLITGALNTSLADVGPQAVLFANAFFGFGAIVGPVLAAAVIRFGPGWRAAPAVASIAVLATLLFAGGVPPGIVERPTSRHGVGGLVRSPLYLLLIAVLGFEIAGEAGLVGWFPTFAVSARDFAPWAAAASVAAFYMGTTVTRLLLARAGSIRPTRLLPGLTVAGTAATVAATLFTGPAALCIVLAIAGAAAGGVFPLVVSGVAEAFPEDLNVGTGMALGTAGSLETLIPLAIGASAAAAGTTTAGMVVVVLAWSASAVAAIGLAAVQRSGPRP